jgi:hypothetical protein
MPSDVTVPVTHWLWHNAEEPTHDDVTNHAATCEMCGRPDEETAKAWHVQSSCFSDHDQATGPPTGRICRACTHAMKTDAYRQQCWLATPTQTRFLETEGQMQRVRGILEDVPSEPFAFFVTTNFVKHGSYKMEPNPPNPDPIRVFYNATHLELPRTAINELLPRLDAAYEHFSKKALRTGDYRPSAIQDYGLRAWKQLDRELDEYRGSAAYDFLVKLCRDQES